MAPCVAVEGSGETPFAPEQVRTLLATSSSRATGHHAADRRCCIRRRIDDRFVVDAGVAIGGTVRRGAVAVETSVRNAVATRISERFRELDHDLPRRSCGKASAMAEHGNDGLLACSSGSCVASRCAGAIRLDSSCAASDWRSKLRRAQRAERRAYDGRLLVFCHPEVGRTTRRPIYAPAPRTLLLDAVYARRGEEGPLAAALQGPRRDEPGSARGDDHERG